MNINLNSLPMVSADLSCLVEYTYDKKGNCIAAHCNRNNLKMQHKARLVQHGKALRAIESIFQPVLTH